MIRIYPYQIQTGSKGGSPCTPVSFSPIHGIQNLLHPIPSRLPSAICAIQLHGFAILCSIRFGSSCNPVPLNSLHSRNNHFFAVPFMFQAAICFSRQQNPICVPFPAVRLYIRIGSACIAGCSPPFYNSTKLSCNTAGRNTKPTDDVQLLCTSYAAHTKQGILSKACQTFCRKQLAERFPVRATPGSCSIRQLAAHTPSGFQIAPLPANWNIFVLEDDWLCAGGLCIKHLAAAAKQRGYRCILSYNHCLLEPTPCHLLLPQIQTAFLSSNLFAPYPGTAQARYNLHTFYQKDFRQKEAVHAPFNRSIIRSLFQESAGMLSIAAKIDAVTQPYYQEALLSHAAEQAAASILQVLSNVL